jgi:hypothetical protein
MKKYVFIFYRKGKEIHKESITAHSVHDACKKADAILENSKRRYDDWALENNHTPHK